MLKQSLRILMIDIARSPAFFTGRKVVVNYANTTWVSATIKAISLKRESPYIIFTLDNGILLDNGQILAGDIVISLIMNNTNPNWIVPVGTNKSGATLSFFYNP